MEWPQWGRELFSSISQHLGWREEEFMVKLGGKMNTN